MTPPSVRDSAVSHAHRWRPLHRPLFRQLLIADFVSDVGTFMQTVGAAWLMVSLHAGPMFVALIQTASALPFFVFVLPAGALGDMVDRRKLILATEGWMFAAAVALAATAVTGFVTPWLLLFLTFALSLGDAVEAPTWRAILPELVEREDLAVASSLNGLEFNLARAVGPGLAGFIVAAVGVGAAFVLNAASFLGVIVVIARWKRPPAKRADTVEGILPAIVAAVQYARASPGMRDVLLRVGGLMFFASALWALLPTVAAASSGGSVGYGVLLALFGIGAVAGTFVIVQVQSRWSVDALVSSGAVIVGAALVITSLADRLSVLGATMLVAGGCWTVSVSLLSTLIQNLAPEHVRARVMALHLLVFQGSIALGSAAWGVMAEYIGVRPALAVAGLGTAATCLLRRAHRLPNASSVTSA